MNDQCRPYAPPKNRDVSPRDDVDIMVRVKDILKKIMRVLDASDEHVKEYLGDLLIIRQNVDEHVVSIEHLELEMIQLFTTINQHQLCTLPRNPIENLKK